ncbi:hypothetical protein CMO89_01455 [Candidatus Woesearchaeota archaeon]|nr:hypothetical protein [Candidatus Woesearchaeota archaeon]|tara:strand:- start:7077 stop:7622 length:546 start_codon:yes stop_codon:yes gene_type:complete
MAERTIVVDHMRLTYEGLFDVNELYKTIDEWLRSKGYDKKEVKNMEKTTAEGKYIELVLEPWKKITTYAKNVIRMRIIMSDIKEVEVEKEKAKIKLNQGKVQIVFDGFFETDYENRWETKPIYYFFRTIFNKYFYGFYTDAYKKNILGDVNHLHSIIKSFLNLYRYSAESWTNPSVQGNRP